MPNTYAMIAIAAGKLREKSGVVAHTPKGEDDTPANPFHGDIFGWTKNDGRNLVADSVILALSDTPFPAGGAG